MTKEQIDDLYVNWSPFDTKVFVWKRQFLPNDYLSMRKTEDGDILLDNFNSTRKINGFNKATWEYMCLHDGLEFHANHSYHTNIVDLKTKGCTAGCWAVNPDGPHYRGCAKFRD